MYNSNFKMFGTKTYGYASSMVLLRIQPLLSCNFRLIEIFLNLSLYTFRMQRTRKDRRYAVNQANCSDDPRYGCTSSTSLSGRIETAVEVHRDVLGFGHKVGFGKIQVEISAVHLGTEQPMINKMGSNSCGEHLIYILSTVSSAIATYGRYARPESGIAADLGVKKSKIRVFATSNTIWTIFVSYDEENQDPYVSRKDQGDSISVLSNDKVDSRPRMIQGATNGDDLKSIAIDISGVHDQRPVGLRAFQLMH
ncbi:hypothetical protein SCHPADRAFT_926224 [Schizopora paradoxa]|uniref:Uncharacterized protein n=1 Tax=Schizopora paradoxa TaxID=27342 RepID=A0A0H2RZE1_9AGAM|nr:hypothetical protein SCHPADRAFT_926224 [Schizopora paradoxa]